MELIAPEALRLTPMSGATPDDLAVALCGGGSVSAALMAWCERFDIGSGELEARVIKRVADGPPSLRVRDALQATPDEDLGFRSVVLRRSGVDLCEAVNWYVPARLTSEMNECLATTTVPFGIIIARLGPRRQNTVAMLPSGGPNVLRVDACVMTAAGVPVAVVRELYRQALIG